MPCKQYKTEQVKPRITHQTIKQHPSLKMESRFYTLQRKRSYISASRDQRYPDKCSAQNNPGHKVISKNKIILSVCFQLKTPTTSGKMPCGRRLKHVNRTVQSIRGTIRFWDFLSRSWDRWSFLLVKMWTLFSITHILLTIFTTMIGRSWLRVPLFYIMLGYILHH